LVEFVFVGQFADLAVNRTIGLAEPLGVHVMPPRGGGTGMSLSPLAERIYQTLVRHQCFPNPLISYGGLVRALTPLPAPYTDLQANDERLFEALGEIARACQSNQPPLPALTSIVVRRTADGSLGTPGPGYFALTFPQVRDEAAKLQIWREEVRRVVACAYSTEPASAARSRPRGSRAIPRWVREPTVIAAVIGVTGTLLAAIVRVWISARRGEAPQPRPAERVVVEILQKSEKPPPPRQAEPTDRKNAAFTLTLDDILEVLARHRQRATFGAVAGILGRDPKSLFNGNVRTPKTARVVNKSTGLPTGTKESDYPPGLLEKERVIDATEEFRVWLREHHSSGQCITNRLRASPDCNGNVDFLRRFHNVADAVGTNSLSSVYAKAQAMRLPRFRIRTVMIIVAFLALVLTVLMQAIMLQRAAVREQLLRAEAELRLAVARAELEQARAEAELKRAFAEAGPPPSAPAREGSASDKKPRDAENR
jgi:hypothetical protein